MHAFGVPQEKDSQEKKNFRFRVSGLSFPFAAPMAAAIVCLLAYSMICGFEQAARGTHSLRLGSRNHFTGARE